VLHHLDVEPAADEQRGQVVPQIVETERLGQAVHLGARGAHCPLNGPRRRLPAGAVGDDVLAAPPSDRSGELQSQLRRNLAADGAWIGTMDEVRLAYRALPATVRAGLTGRPWPASTDKLATMLALATAELARRGIEVERGAGRLIVRL